MASSPIYTGGSGWVMIQSLYMYTYNVHVWIEWFLCVCVCRLSMHTGVSVYKKKHTHKKNNTDVQCNPGLKSEVNKCVHLQKEFNHTFFQL